MPPATDWYAAADPTYPRGQLKFYPATERGLAVTFQHQDAPPNEYLHDELVVQDPIKMFNVYGYSFCSVASKVLLSACTSWLRTQPGEGTTTFCSSAFVKCRYACWAPTGTEPA